MIHATTTEEWHWPAPRGHNRTWIGKILVEWSGTEPTEADVAAHLAPPVETIKQFVDDLVRNKLADPEADTDPVWNALRKIEDRLSALEALRKKKDK